MQEVQQQSDATADNTADTYQVQIFGKVTADASVDCDESQDDLRNMDAHDTYKMPPASNVFALLNTVIGAGMLGLPWAFAHAGFVLGSILLIVFASTSWFGLHLLACTARAVNPDPSQSPSSFKGVADEALPKLSLVVDAVVCIKCFGVGTSYLMLVGEGMANVTNGMLGRDAWIVAGVSIAAPLAFRKKLTGHFLSVTNTLAVIIAACVVMCIIIYTLPALDPCKERNECRGSHEAFPSSGHSLPRAFCIFIFSYTCHQNAFSTLHNELQPPLPKLADAVSFAAVASALCMYLCMSTAGFIIFGSAVQSDILQNFPESDIVFSIARAAISLLVVFSYPLQVHPARKSVFSLIESCSGMECDKNNYAHWVVTSMFVACSLILALLVDDFGLALAMVGATGSTTITFILPAFVYCRLFPEPHVKRNIAILHGAVGCIIGPFALISNILSAAGH